MPKAHKGSLSIDDLFGIEDTITQQVYGIYEYLSIPSKQLDTFVTYITNLAQGYEEHVNSSIGKPAQEFARIQQQIAETLVEIGKQVAELGQTGIVIRSLREDTLQNRISPQPPTVDIFLQPERLVSIPKGKLSRKRKQIFPLSALSTSGKKFVLGEQVIKHFTIHSQRGEILDLLRLTSAPSQKDMAKAARVDDDYRALSFVLRDLKRVLEKNNLVLRVTYDEDSKTYKSEHITRYIRVPKRKKKTAKTS